MPSVPQMLRIWTCRGIVAPPCRRKKPGRAKQPGSVITAPRAVGRFLSEGLDQRLDDESATPEGARCHYHISFECNGLLQEVSVPDAEGKSLLSRRDFPKPRWAGDRKLHELGMQIADGSDTQLILTIRIFRPLKSGGVDNQNLLSREENRIMIVRGFLFLTRVIDCNQRPI